MKTKKTSAVLEDKVKVPEAEKKTTCGFCRKDVDIETAYRSPGNNYYCSFEHFYLFTED